MIKVGTNTKEVERNLKQLSSKIERGAMREGLQKASRPMLAETKNNARKFSDSGLLVKSLKIKITTNKKTGVVSSTIGPDKSVQGEVKNELTGETVIRKPVRYAHLVEFGHKLVSALSKTYGHVKGQPFMRPAFDNKKEEAIKIYANTIKEAIPKIANKLDKKKK